jgi:hypothetical protein
MRSNHWSAIYALAIGLPFTAAPCEAQTQATELSTCELIDSGSTLDGQLVAVKAHINTDGMHFTNLESEGCRRKQIAMYFAEDATTRPCGDSEFAKTVECPLNGSDYLIEATFVGVYHAAKPTLEVKELQGMKRTPRDGGAVFFNARVQEAKDLEETPDGKAYQDSMWPVVEPFVAALTKQCIADDAKRDLTSFVWVATIASDGKVHGMEVQPQTGVAKCFSSGMAQAPFPRPPASFADEGMPVTLNMRLHRMN